jgi:hypothetical protein
MTKHVFSTVEILEDRIAPAGIVTVGYNAATGELSLTGDAADNQVNLFQTGPNQYRIEGLTATTLNPGGFTFIDIGKLAMVTINGGNGNDTFNLTNLLTLKRLSFDGAGGFDNLLGINITTIGRVDLEGGADPDNITFDGASTVFGGKLEIRDTSGGLGVFFNAGRTVIGGSVIFEGGDGFDQFTAGGPGTISLAKGLDFDGGAGSSAVQFQNQGRTSIGQLATVESVLFNGGDGSDTLLFAAANSALAGGVRMTGGMGGDAISFSNSQSKTRIGTLASGQSILFDGGAGNDAIAAVGARVAAAGGIEFLAGDGANTVNLGSANGSVALGNLAGGQSIKFTGGVGNDSMTFSPASLTLAGAIDVAGGEGTNTITLNSPNGTATLGKLATGASIRFTGGAGDDSLTIESARLFLAGGISVAGGDGTNTITLNGSNGRAVLGKMAGGQSLKYVGGVNNDTFVTGVSAFIATGGLQFDGGDGTNSINLGGSNGTVRLGKLATGQSIDYTGGSGSDSVSSLQARVIMAGGIEIDGGDGNNGLNMDAEGKIRLGVIVGGQSIKVTGGSGNDSSFLGGNVVTLQGSAEMTGGSGGDSIDFDGSRVTIGKTVAGDSIVLVGNDGSDGIDLEESVTLLGKLTLDGGAGNDFLGLDLLDSLTVNAAVTFDGGPDNDTLTIDVHTLLLGGKLTFTAGSGTDNATINAQGAVVGDIILDLGTATAGNQNALLTGRNGLRSALSLKGELAITGDGDAATTDSLTITNVAVKKAIDVSLGAGVSTVNIDNLVARDVLDLSTGDGADVINIERNNFFGNSIIAKLATIQAGTGDDMVLIGSATPPPNGGLADSTRVRFIGGLNVAGGVGGADQRNDIAGQNDFPLGAPTISGFEVVVP